jgi:hypothetical protein
VYLHIANKFLQKKISKGHIPGREIIVLLLLLLLLLTAIGLSPGGSGDNEICKKIMTAGKGTVDSVWFINVGVNIGASRGEAIDCMD